MMLVKAISYIELVGYLINGSNDKIVATLRNFGCREQIMEASESTLGFGWQILPFIS